MTRGTRRLYLDLSTPMDAYRTDRGLHSAVQVYFQIVAPGLG
jgi:hypothetical protein